MQRKLLVIQVAAMDAGFDWPRLPMGPMQSVFPAVTCTAQATFRTAGPPGEHGMVANGRWFPELHKAMFWEQSADLVDGRRIWSDFRRAGGTVGLMFWQQSLGEQADLVLSPAPIHKHHGGMIMDCYSRPAGLYGELRRAIGKPFPLHRYWGPLANETVGDWIAEAVAHVLGRGAGAPDLLLTYLPSLDYQLQRYGPGHRRCRRAAERTRRQLDRLADAAEAAGYDLLVFGDYAIGAADRPVWPNRALGEAGLLAVRHVGRKQYADLHATRAFAVVDHEAAHVHVPDPGDLPAATEALSALEGVEAVLDREAQRRIGLAHPHSGQLVLRAAPGCWFAYPWWTEPRSAPDFAGHVDIHNKPGFDPCELFFGFPPPKVSQDASRVRGSHGRTGPDRAVGLASTVPALNAAGGLAELAAAVSDYIHGGAPHAERSS